MKTKTANLSRLNILGNGGRSSDREIFTATLKRWRQKLAYCSIFAAVPAILASHVQVQEARSDEAKKTEPSVAARDAMLRERLNMSISNPALLKRQSEFRLPHQKGNFAMLAALGGSDDCPGAAIPGGNYTAAAPLIESGDTTGANDTVNSLFSYYYYSYAAFAPDHVYAFTLTGRGPNPQIEVSTTSGTYRPLIYVLQGGDAGTCPAGTGNFAYPWVMSDSRWTAGSTATLDSWAMNSLPLNVPLHLFVDSAYDDAGGSGPYTIRMQDVTIASAASPNSIDSAEFFITQQYQDFLRRSPEPGPDGIYGTADDPLKYYLDLINNYLGTPPCTPSNVECLKVIRGIESANFFRSPEFQRKGNYVMSLYMASVGQRPVTPSELGDSTKVDRPHYAEFLADLQSISTPNDDAVLTNAKKDDLAVAWLQRTEIQNKYGGLSNADFVQTLLDTAGVTISNQDQLVNDLETNQKTRAQVLRIIAECPEVNAKFYKQAFVTMEYFGYLRRDPEDCHNPQNWTGNDPNQCGYIFHNNRFNLGFDPADVENVIVRGFIESPEYRQRFGQP